MPKFEKGSQEAKDFMASIRAKRGGSPTKCPCGKSKKKCSCADGSVSSDSGGADSLPPPPKPRSKNRNKNKPILEPNGEGIISDAVDAVKTGASKVGQYAKAVVFGRGEVYPPKVRGLIDRFGTKTITSAELRRSPVQSLLTSAMNALTFGKFKKNMAQTPYDQLFHLQIVLTLDDGTKLLLEKNEVINMDILKSQTLAKGTEVLPITPFTSVVLNDALEKTKASMGSKAYFDYNAENNNCQDFISSFMRANGMGDANDLAFVKQDTKKLFKGLSGLAKTAYTLTELGERANVLLTGAGMTSSKVADKETEDLKERLDKKMAVAKATQSTLYKKAMKAEKEASKAKKVMSGKGGGSSKAIEIPKKDSYTQKDIDKLLADNERLRMLNSAIKEKKELGIGKKVAQKMTDNMTSADFTAIEAKGRELEEKFKDAPKPKPVGVKKQVSSDAVSNFAGILKSASGKMAGKGASSSVGRTARFPSPPPTPPPTPRFTDLQRAQAEREWNDRAQQIERRERMFALSQARSQLRDTQEQLNQASSAVDENRLYNLAGFLRYQVGVLEEQLGLIQPSDITEREAYIPTTIGSDSMTDDSDRTETERYMSGRGARSSKIAIAPAAEEIIAADLDSRIGSTESSRMPRAVAVAAAPMAQSISVEEAKVRKQLKKIHKGIVEIESIIRNIENRIYHTRHSGLSNYTKYVEMDMESLENYRDELRNLRRLERIELDKLPPTEVTMEGAGIIKPLPKGFKGSGMVRF